MKSSNHSVGHHHLHFHLRPFLCQTYQVTKPTKPTMKPTMKPTNDPTNDPPMTRSQLHQGLRFGEAALQNAWSQGAAALPHRRWCQGEHLKARNFGSFLVANCNKSCESKGFLFCLGKFCWSWDFLGEFEVFLFCLL